MLESLKQIDWKDISENADHTYNFFDLIEEDYTMAPRLLRKIAKGDRDARNELEEGMFGEMQHDLDGLLFELVLPFLWEIVLGENSDATAAALSLIAEGYGRFYSMENDEIALTMGENGVEKLPAKLLGNDAKAALAKLKTLASQNADEELRDNAINVLSMVPDFPDETTAFFQSLLNPGSELTDNVVLSALGRLRYRNKLSITPDFQKYVDDATKPLTQAMAAFWISRFLEDEAPEEVETILEEDNLFEMLEKLPYNSRNQWYYDDYSNHE